MQDQGSGKRSEKIRKGELLAEDVDEDKM